MAPSLSIVLPVHNAESILADRIADLLDLLSDLTSQFEILVVDDGSTDQTEEIAVELARHYPQLRVARHSDRLGTAAAIRTGMTHTDGEVVMVQEEDSPIRGIEIRRLWTMRHDPQLVMARADGAPRPLSPELLDRLVSWADQLYSSSTDSNQGGIQMIRRQAVEQLDDSNRRQHSVRVCRMTPQSHLPLGNGETPETPAKTTQEPRVDQ